VYDTIEDFNEDPNLADDVESIEVFFLRVLIVKPAF